MRSITSLVAAVSLLVSGGGAPAASASLVDPAQSAEYVRTAYDGTIYELTDTSITALTYAEWSSLGFPAFVPARTDFVQVTGLATVYAVTKFSEFEEEWFSEPITYQEYRQAGSPRPVQTVWADGLSVHKWSTSPELFVTDETGAVAKLTYAWWAAAGFPGFDVRENRGFVRMSWDAGGSIAYMCDVAAGRGGTITYAQWTSLGSPSPATVARVPNDIVIKPANSNPNAVFYSGPITHVFSPGILGNRSTSRLLSYREWRAMGSPAPRMTNIYNDVSVCMWEEPGPWD